MSHQNDLDMGIVSISLLQLAEGNKPKSATNAAKLVKALGWLAVGQRTGESNPPSKRNTELREALALGILSDIDSDIRFTNAQIQALAETSAVAEHLQPDYVDRAGMYDRAINHLGLIGAGAVPLLVEMLGSNETSVANGASFALGSIGEPALGALRWAILYGNARVRYYAMNAFSVLKRAQPLSEELLQLIATVLSEDEHAMVKNAAIGALGESTDPIAIEALRGALGENPVTKSLAETELKKLDLPAARRALDDANRNLVKSQMEAPQGGWQIGAPHAQQTPKRTPRVFLSYARENKSQMEEYRRRLNLSGFEVWSDSEHLVAGENWDERIRNALSASDFVVALLSTYSWDGYQVMEINLALSQSPKQEVPFILPMFLDRKDWKSDSEKWPAGLNKTHVIVADDFSNGWTQLYSALQEAARLSGLSIPLRLRDQPRRDLEEHDVWRTVFDRDFFSRQRNPKGRPLGEEWDLKFNGAFALDRATDLIWTRSPVAHYDYLQALGVPGAYKEKAKDQGIVVPRLLRLPTLEEAASLMTPVENDEGWYRRKYLKGSQYMLTCDTKPAPEFVTEVKGMVWVADFCSTDFAAVPWNSPWPVWLVASG